MRLQPRDILLLQKLGRCRWLTTSQIQRLYFPNVSLDFVRKRLRKLVRSGYFFRFQPDRMSEALYGFGKPPKHIRHLIGINEIRIVAEKRNCEFFYAYWELGQFNWEYPIIPDVVCKAGDLYLIEYDTGSENRKQLKEKFTTYACFQFAYTLVLVADTPRRLTTLQRLAQIVGLK